MAPTDDPEPLPSVLRRLGKLYAWLGPTLAQAADEIDRLRMELSVIDEIERLRLQLEAINEAEAARIASEGVSEGGEG